MQVGILAVGRLKTGPERELCERYLERARDSGRALGFRGFDVTEIAELRAVRAPERKAGEAAALIAAIPKNAVSVCLDAGGEMVDSEAFAGLLCHAASTVGRMAFVIGGADGLGVSYCATRKGGSAFGRVTWPHQVARILLAEQLYRAMTILSGHPYHRA